MTDLFGERSCRLCHGDLETILDLGSLALSTFLRPDDPPPDRAPLDLCACVDCATVQLRHTVDPDRLFRKYWYVSGINETMRAELADVVSAARQRVAGLTRYDTVIDVGANDGTLLANYGHVPTRIAFEPARNFHGSLHREADLVVADYFPQALSQVGKLDGHVAILTSIAMFYDLDEPREFVAAVKQILAPGGVWVVQFQDLDQMLKQTAFDNIVHEHLVYYSLASFERLIAPYQLEVFDAEVRAINGGSYRLYVGHAAGDRDLDGYDRVNALRHREAGCEDWQTLQRFVWRAIEVKRQLQAMLDLFASTEQTVDVYAASTKFSTLSQWCGIAPPLVRQAWERTPEKYGLQTVTGIPIVPEGEGRSDPPVVLLAGAWHFKEAFLQREAKFIEQGGQFLFPLPYLDIVQAAHVGA